MIGSENLGKLAKAYSWTSEVSDEDALPVDDKSCTVVEALQAAKEAEAAGLQILQKIVHALGDSRRDGNWLGR